MTAVYIWILNLLPHHLHKRETMLTTQVVSNSDLKVFGYNRCFSRLVSDLNELIENGLQLTEDGPTYPVRVGNYRLDNLERNKVSFYKFGRLITNCLIIYIFSGLSDSGKLFIFKILLVLLLHYDA